ncbi:MAG: PH domain-containing protein [Prevotellaceae bacterium]|jgi:hypothetical protein|nr:PH domain-containing protein [Prevotellaceae bacterium]
MTEFICNWDTTTIIITILTLVIVFAISVSMIIKFTQRQKLKGKNHGLVLFSLIFVYLLPVLLIIPFCYMPTKINFDNENLVVRQIKGKIEIPINEISEIRKIKKGDFENTVRTFGSGGLFGYLGKFENSQFGKFQMYATNSTNRFVVKTENKIFIFSCKNSEELIELINNQIK